MTTEAGSFMSAGDLSSALSSPQGLFALAALVWLTLLTIYVVLWRTERLPTNWQLPIFRRKPANSPLINALWDRSRDLAQVSRVHADQLEVILEHVTMLVALVDENDRVTYGNKALLSCVSTALEEPVPLLTLFDLESTDADNLRGAVAEARRQGSATTQLRIHSTGAPEPREYVVRLDRASNIPNSGHLVLSLQDVTASAKTYHALLRARKVDLLGKITSSYVHDLNNLLFVVRSGTDLVALALPEDHPTQPDLKAIREATQQASSVVAEMLSVARASGPNGDVTSPTEVLLGMEKVLRRLVGRQVALELDLPSDSFALPLSVAEFQQIVLNLVVNASQAVGREGKIGITVQKESQDTVELTVSDNGAGIAREPLEHIFEPLYSTKSLQESLGLGLATVKSLVGRIGGKIEFSSDPKTGTRVSIRIPKVKDSRMSADTPSIQPNGNGPMLLVLDDEDQVRRLMVRLLARDGYQILEASAIDDALDKAKEATRLDVWVTDANVDGIDATDFIEQMRTLHPNVAIVLVSGREPDPDKMDMLDEQGVTFLAKPFTPAELRQAIDQAYRRGLATSTVVSLSSESVAAVDGKAR